MLACQPYTCAFTVCTLYLTVVFYPYAAQLPVAYTPALAAGEALSGPLVALLAVAQEYSGTREGSAEPNLTISMNYLIVLGFGAASLAGFLMAERTRLKLQLHGQLMDAHARGRQGSSARAYRLLRPEKHGAAEGERRVGCTDEESEALQRGVEEGEGVDDDVDVSCARLWGPSARYHLWQAAGAFCSFGIIPSLAP
jgi:hypothetical protein